MKNVHEHVWLTSVLKDSDVLKALTLSFSLRKVYTSHKIAIIVSPKVSVELWDVLSTAFDFVFSLDLNRNTAGLEDEEFVKVYALTLTGFKSCVMLSPTMLADGKNFFFPVVSNSDELLEENNNDTQQFVWSKSGIDDGTIPIFILRPSIPVFKVLMKQLQQRNGTCVLQYLKNWDRAKIEKIIPEKYSRNVNSETGILIGNQKDICIVNVVGEPKLDGETKFFGVVGQRVMDLWKRIQTENVSPLLESMKNSSTLDVESVPRLLHNRGGIAIIGMSCRYPGANNLEEFWNILVEGQDATGNPPEFRWLKGQFPQNSKPEFRKTNAGFLKCPVDDFDAKFFNISPKELMFLDPQHRLLHELVWEGLEDAAINPYSLEGTNGGVFMGSWTNDYQDILYHAGNDEFYRMYMGNSIGAGAARISHLLGMTGPSIATESGCSAAMVAVHLACTSLQNRETNLALACGVNLLLRPFDKDLMPMVVSPDGHCKTFDAKADGFARGEGCGVLVLKRLSDAVRDGDKIWGVIRGSGMTQEGVSKSMGTPTVHGESLAMKAALENGGVDPAMVSYVEAHGTGTIVGDPMEVAAIAKAYHSDERKEPLFIGSVKTNVGHTESCSGITGIMKVVLALQNETIPPHRNFEKLNPAIDLDAVPAKIPLESVKWSREAGLPRYAGVSSFGITGTDAHVILEEAPHIPANALCSSTTPFERPLHIMKITAKTDEALDILLENYRDTLTTNNDDDFKDLAYTSNIGRADFSQRAIVISKTKEDAVKNIEQRKLTRGEESKESIGKLCFLFTGQGSQYPGMAKQLYETSPVFRMHFEYCEKILKNQYNIDFTQVLWSDSKSAEISRTIYSQTSIFCVEYALLKLWESWGVQPDFVVGHSLGEFAAAVCADILTVEDAIRLVAERSRLIDDLPHGKMLVIKADKLQVDTLMKKYAGNDKSKVLDYAAINSPEQTVVAGDSELIMQFSECCKQANLKFIVLEATHAFHSKHMDPMLREYKGVAKTVKKLDGNGCQYISGMRGTTVDAEEVDAQYWVSHTREKVLFLDASKKAVELGCRTFIEIGPQPVLAALTMMNNDTQLTCLPSLKKSENEWETLLTTLGKLYVKGLEIDWKGFDQFYNRKKVSLPHYPFIGKKFWPDLLSVTGSTIHPLVGSVVPNASSTKIFQNGPNLRTLEYVKDHAIGDNVIFPGAGYLEMCLAAGLATIEGSTDFLPPPVRPMKVENLSIQAPLWLQEGKTCQVQTVVDYNTSQGNDMDWNDLTIKIFHKLESESTKWLSHAQGTFSPLPSAEEKEVLFCPKIFQETLSKPSNDGILTEIYDKLASIGLKFGPTFRSIEKLWREEDSKTLLAKVKVPSSAEETSNYVLHPVVLDAMIQAVMILRHTSNIKRKLYVPIKIGKFVWLSGTESSELYIHAFSSSSEENSVDSALLLDSTGTAIALMSSVEFIDTTVKAINSVLQQQTSSLPEMWENVWRATENRAEKSLDLSSIAGSFCDEEFVEKIDRDLNTPTPFLEQTFNELCHLVYLNYLKALYELGWKPVLNQEFKESGIFSELKVQDGQRKYFGFMMDVLASEGILQKVDEDGTGQITLRVVMLPPNIKDLHNTLALPEFSSDLSSKFKPTLLYSKLFENLSEILLGTQSVLPILFPEEKQGWPSAADFYLDYAQLFRVSELGREVGNQRFSWVKEGMMSSGKKLLRILEIGAGTGSYTENFIKGLELMNVTDFEYTYTDISAAFFPAAQKRFERHASKMIFKKLNVEEDPIEQGFVPEYYDYVYMAEVIHATRDIKESLRNLRMLMKPWAKLDMLEQTRIHRFITSLFGNLEGFWRFQDLDLRPKHCTLSKETWERVYQENGFGIDGIFSVLNNYHSYVFVHKVPDNMLQIAPKTIEKGKVWLLFHSENSPVSNFLQEKIGAVEGRRVLTITEGNGRFEEGENLFKIRRDREEDYKLLFKAIQEKNLKLEGILYCWGLDETKVTQEEILQPYFYVTKTLLLMKMRTQPRVIAVTRHTIPVKDNELTHYHSSSLWAFTKTLKNEHQEINCRTAQVADGELDEVKLQSIFYEIWNPDKEVQVAYHGTTRFVARMQPHNPKINALDLPKGTERYQLILPETKTISDLAFGPRELRSLGEYEVEIQVRVSALNFRDLLSVLKPSEEFKNINMVGFDFSGTVKRIGDKVTRWTIGDLVCGCNMENIAFPSHLYVREDCLLALPTRTTLCEAATIPAVYVTSVVCLNETAKIKKEDVVLIHTATGGVGLSAIEICKHVGCTIIATAGSKRKQNYLRSIGIEHIFHSRNTQYGDEILKLTCGKGVDVVLNSLTSEGFKEATLKACAKGARFVEMSKLNIWRPEEVKKLRPDVDYTIIDVSSADDKEWDRFMVVLRELMDKEVIKPIPYVRFDGLNIREALQYMQKAKHIGKIVCVMPELRNEGGEMRIHTPMFNDNSTYLITGGLGGIGFEVCKWIIEMGGKHVVLASRGLPSSSMQCKISELNSKGANVIPVQLDVSNFEQCKDLIENKIGGNLQLPPLRGVMHAAGIINDAFIENQDWPKLSSTFGTKIDGTLNLHELTKNLPLEHFVTFSSSSALFGPPGQCNHAAGNEFEDALIHYRNSIGLPGTTVNWGQWGEVGIATEIDVPGIKPMSNLQAITGLEYAMKSQKAQMGINNVESFVMFSKIVPYLSTYLDERVWKKTVKATPVGIRSDEFWQKYDAKSELEEKREVLKEHIRIVLRTTLKLDDGDSIDDEGNFQEMGVDSLMFVEIKNCLQSLLGDRLTLNASTLKDGRNINELSDTLLQQIEGLHAESMEKPTTEEVNELIREDSVLPEHIRAKADQEAVAVKDIKRILLTGCTGTLGSYILKGLVANPQISEVICLMRENPANQEKSLERLQKILEAKELLSDVNLEKVQCVVGNLALPHLGLEPDVWAELSESIDAIVHCAAHVNHTEYYVKHRSKQVLRAANIGGTVNLLEFACEGRLKHVYFASTLLAVATVDEEERMSEDFPKDGEYDGVTSFAYPISKFVGDVLAGRAMERGIPSKVFRFPLLGGNSKTGRYSIENNHFIMRYLFILKNGAMQSNPAPVQILPVDMCADASLQLFFNEKAPPGVYNITHLQPSIDQEFVSVAKKFDRQVDLVELSQFFEQVKAAEKQGGTQEQTSSLAMFAGVYQDDEEILAHYASVAIVKKWVEGNDEIWRNKKVTQFLPNFYAEQRPTMEYVYNDLLFAKGQGWFTKFGL